MTTRLSLLSLLLLGMTTLNLRAEDKREMLSKHQTVAQFTGISYHQCRGLTSLCPDKCGESGDLASFHILKYLAYEKPGQYGDEQQKDYQFLVQDNMKKRKVSPELKAKIDGLQPNAYVLLDWQHDYVTKGGSKFPERIVIQLKPISREEAAKAVGGADKLPKPETNQNSKPAGIQPTPFGR
jgi:hypothetical protein